MLLAGSIVLVVAVVAIVVAFGLSSPGTGRADPDDRAQVALGKSIYEKACASCHGIKLEGQPNWRSTLPRGGLPAPPHDESGHTWHHADPALFRITKFGGKSEALPGFVSNMPAFGETLSDSEIWSALAYIKSHWSPVIRARQEEINRRNKG